MLELDAVDDLGVRILDEMGGGHSYQTSMRSDRSVTLRWTRL